VGLSLNNLSSEVGYRKGVERSHSTMTRIIAHHALTVWLGWDNVTLLAPLPKLEFSHQHHQNWNSTQLSLGVDS